MGYECRGGRVSMEVRGERALCSDSSKESGACGSERILPDSPTVFGLRSFTVFSQCCIM